MTSSTRSTDRGPSPTPTSSSPPTGSTARSARLRGASNHISRAARSSSGSDHAGFEAFHFIFRESEHGLFQVARLPFDDAQHLHRRDRRGRLAQGRADRAGIDESLAYCERLFAPELDAIACSTTAAVDNFRRVKNATSPRQPGLIGDAAHTAHFSSARAPSSPWKMQWRCGRPRQPRPVEDALVAYERRAGWTCSSCRRRPHQLRVVRAELPHRHRNRWSSPSTS